MPLALGFDSTAASLHNRAMQDTTHRHSHLSVIFALAVITLIAGCAGASTRMPSTVLLAFTVPAGASAGFTELSR